MDSCSNLISRVAGSNVYQTILSPCYTNLDSLSTRLNENKVNGLVDFGLIIPSMNISLAVSSVFMDTFVSSLINIEWFSVS